MKESGKPATEKKWVRWGDWEEESGLPVRMASKGVSGDFGCARERVSAGRLAESGELTTKEKYHRSYWKSRRKTDGRSGTPGQFRVLCEGRGGVDPDRCGEFMSVRRRREERRENPRPPNPRTGHPHGTVASGEVHGAPFQEALVEEKPIEMARATRPTYIYDAEGHRVKRTVGSVVTVYALNPAGQVINETDANLNFNVHYIYLGGQLMAEMKDGTTYFAHTDHLGSVQLLTKMDESGYDYFDSLPFGEWIGGGSGTTHKFTGDERDGETGLDHTWFRKYSSQLGRWTTADPAGLMAVSLDAPQSLNRYSYVSNMPLSYVDPGGLWTGPTCGTAEYGCPPSTPAPSPCSFLVLSCLGPSPTPPASCPPFIACPTGGGGGGG